MTAHDSLLWMKELLSLSEEFTGPRIDDILGVYESKRARAAFRSSRYPLAASSRRVCVISKLCRSSRNHRD